MPLRSTQGWIQARTGLAALTRHSDILLACLVVGIVAMMIIPLPTMLLDILITTNISIAVILVLVCIYVSNALRIATLPSILLITTLFRLGLNVSSTRLILLQADAGEVIRSFGQFVVAGNLIVGVVIFLILTLIQFVVIAKGSERVAEVAARFTLDAMPGRQMSIDADLRAGTIETQEARRLRAALQRESQLYGSMDGAMKFVKGDAIAGILITIINIVAGLLIGVLQREMAVGEAARVYSILTIGDGLVSQIPALLISTAAGIVVTRVASEDEGAHLGKEIGQQVMAQPKAIAIGAGLLLLLALVPGLPALPFLLLGSVAGALAYGLITARRRVAAAVPPADEIGAELEGMAPAAPVSLEIGAGLTSQINSGSPGAPRRGARNRNSGSPGAPRRGARNRNSSTDGGRLMAELIPGLRELIFSELGVVLPGVQVNSAVEDLPPDAYRILLSEIPMGEGVIPKDTVLAMADRKRLLAEGIPEVTEIDLPGVHGPVCRVPTDAQPALGGLGVETIDPPTQITLHLGQMLKTYAFEFVGIQETQQLLDSFARSHPTLVNEVVPKVVSLQTLSEVLQRLVEEGVSIRNLRQILGALAEWGAVEKEPGALSERVRNALRRQISHRFTTDDNLLRALLLDPMIEQAVRDSIQSSDQGSYLAMEPDLSRDIIDSVRDKLEGHPADVILTTMELRRHVRRLVEADLPGLPVLAYTELLPDVRVQAVARVRVG